MIQESARLRRAREMVEKCQRRQSEEFYRIILPGWIAELENALAEEALMREQEVDDGLGRGAD